MTELERLIAWYAAAWLAEAEGIEQLHYGVNVVEDKDQTGAPAWTPEFKGFIFANGQTTDEEGWYRRPLRAALLSVAMNDAGHYSLLSRLRGTWDVEEAAGYGPDAEERMLGALRNLRRLYQERAA